MFDHKVRRDSLPPAFELPEEVARAVREPLPALRRVSLEEEVKGCTRVR